MSKLLATNIDLHLGKHVLKKSYKKIYLKYFLKLASYSKSAKYLAKFVLPWFVSVCLKSHKKTLMSTVCLHKQNQRKLIMTKR